MEIKKEIMHKTTILLITTISTILSFSTPLLSQKNVIDEVIAVVGDNAILKSDVEYQYQQAVMQGISAKGNLKCKLFEQQLIQKLMLNQAILDSVEISENNVINEVDRRMNEFINRAGGREKLEEWFNKSVLQIKKEQMTVVRDQMLTESMQRTITENIEPTPSQVRAYYRKTPQDSLPMIPVQYEIQKIAIYPKIEQKEIDRVKSKLRDFQKQVAEGRDFATLAVLYSEDPGSATSGGDLGWSTRGTFVPEFANVAFNMQEKNKVSKIVQTEFGYHIIQMLDRKGERIHVRHILLKPKVSADANKNAISKLDSISDLIHKEELSFEEAALYYSMDKDTRNNGGLMVNMRTQSSNFELSSIQQPQLAKELQKLKEGEISKPFGIKDDKGHNVYVIIKQKRKIDPHRANLKDDYQLVQNIMTEKRRQDAVNEWIREKQQDTYITIHDDWRDCDFEFKNWIK
ncbi:peptidyl-prolyl cis-trans isomerase SurA [Saccharicrinis fermentans DSM 9555 = JCM 21142]|uniref:Peptidyl-prolyl cis-trans isomerase SurA n=2 Tax=Saccharicrinis fermentans TaxID=982 RepID=W7YKT0_9BACT|nr:peptidyl-prolyl cis-trans isomerase SurA [Saccharicrinis fermentans DSM 9555 = JCM 21142]